MPRIRILLAAGLLVGLTFVLFAHAEGNDVSAQKGTRTASLSLKHLRLKHHKAYYADLESYLEEFPAAQDRALALQELLEQAGPAGELERAQELTEAFLKKHSTHYLASSLREELTRAMLLSGDTKQARELCFEAVESMENVQRQVDLLGAVAHMNALLLDLDGAHQCFDAMLELPVIQMSERNQQAIEMMRKLRLDGLGKDFKHFKVLDIEGNELNTKELFEGKTVYFHFWSVNHEPSIMGLPKISEAWLLEHLSGFDVVSISLDPEEDLKLLKQTIESLELPGRHLRESADFKGDLAKHFGVHAIPYGVLVDDQGKIVAKDLRASDLLESLRVLNAAK